MHFLLTNDDGFDSPELHLLCEAAAARGHRITVSAPEEQQSAKSHAFSVFSPLFVREDRMPGAERAYRVRGTPVDSCRLGFMSLAGDRVDAVLSGINAGFNVGLATYVSGTVGAAREAAFAGYPALAVSMEPRTPDDMRAYFADYAVRTAEMMVRGEAAYPPQAVCNLNAPCCRVEELKGAKVCGISHLIYKDSYVRYDGPRGDITYWLRPMEPEYNPEPGLDLGLLMQNWITVTFLTPEPCDQRQWESFPLPS
ncbi:MAG: 5'/3'-nucleotidase SurE [Clostridia bacterium]|nr:5'/3'-nucleotidase SurE [Clostridia bacterium]